LRRSPLILIILAIGIAAGWQQPAPAAAQGLAVDAVIWHFGGANGDYPGAEQNDSLLPIDWVYVKTHDGTNWMSTFDSHSAAVSGPEQIKKLRDEVYGPQGIGLAAWFVPKGTNVSGQLDMAKAVIDAGVDVLLADVEPYAGFCNDDCAHLAETFWKQLREQRPNATLGVIYDPRPAHWEKAGLKQWLAHSDWALPMCYWEAFSGQGDWGDPAGCVTRAHTDLVETLAPDKNIKYAPMLQAYSTTGERVTQAMDAAYLAGSERVSLYRRGTATMDIWNAVATYTPPGGPPQSPVTAAAWGDIDCSGAIDIGDAVKLARGIIGLSIGKAPGCPEIGDSVEVGDVPQTWGDIDCDGVVSIGDALKTSRKLLGLSVSQQAECPSLDTVVSFIARAAEPAFMDVGPLMEPESLP
jgi:hypothetical protein